MNCCSFLCGGSSSGNDEERSQFIVSAQTGDLSSVRSFVDQHADGDIDNGHADHSGLNALHAAVIGQQHEVAAFLLAHGANVHSKTPTGRRFKRIYNRLWHSRTFIQNTARVTNRAGRTVVHNACARSDAKMVQMLLENGAAPDLERRCDDGMTPLEYATEWRRQDIIELLSRR